MKTETKKMGVCVSGLLTTKSLQSFQRVRPISKFNNLGRGSLTYRMKNNKLPSRFFKHIRAVYPLLPEDKP